MNQQELQGLHEAYMEVYNNELDEGAEGRRFEYNQRHGRPLITPEVSQSRSSQGTLGGGTYQRGSKRLPKSKRKYDRQVLSGVRAASDQEKQRARERMGIGENYDLYDIILSHLLDEGYAETPEAAEVIMVNMSEDWRESIVEEMTTSHDFIRPDSRRGANRPPSAPVLPPPSSSRSNKPKPTSSIPKLPPKGTPLGVGWGP